MEPTSIDPAPVADPSLPYQSLLLVSFGGPEGPDDVLPFLENVLRGRNVPRERMLEVAEHYNHFGGVSPINEQNRQLIRAIEAELERRGLQLPVYFGNRNWKPYLGDALEQMQQAGIQRSLAFFTSTFSCYSGCRQYRENIAAAQQHLGENAPQVNKVRMGFNHPLFIEACAERVMEQLDDLPPQLREHAHLVFTAHSIPNSMADNCNYEKQLREASRLVAAELAAAGRGELKWDLVYQSRSGPPHQPWLEPDVCDFLEKLHADGTSAAVIMPIGFVSDHMEVLFDLDTEAREKADELGLEMRRAGSVGVHPKFVRMIVDLVEERMFDKPRTAIGELPASHDVCPENCCLPGSRPQRPSPESTASHS